MKNVLTAAYQYLGSGSGLQRFLLWCRDSAAFERRTDSSFYTDWLLDKQASRPAGPTGAEAAYRWTVDGHLPRSDLERLRRDDDTSRLREFVLLEHEQCPVAEDDLAGLVRRARRDGAAVAYADEDQRLGPGFADPSFKPDFSIDLLRECDYIGPVFLVRVRDLLELDDEVAAATLTPYELLLHVYERGGLIAHTDEVVLHWSRPRPVELDERHTLARDGHLRRCYGDELGPALLGEAGSVAAVTRCHRVSIIIPTRDRLDLLACCVESIYAHEVGVAFEVVILDNGSQEPATLTWLEEAQQRFPDFRVVRADFEFNWSRLNNLGAVSCSGDRLLFLNNDVEVLNPGWLDELVVQSSRPEVGAVGALLLYPNGRIQHAGVVVGLGGFADHIYADSPETVGRHVFVDPRYRRNVLVCTGACLMMSRAAFEAVGGFDETLAICGDVHICLALHALGYLNVYDARVRLIHHESATRSRAPLPASEIDGVMPLAATFLEAGDPYYNRNLSLNLRYPMFQRGERAGPVGVRTRGGAGEQVEHG